MSAPKSEYNILKIAGSSFGRVATDETRAKLAAAMKGIREGIPKSEETKAKMSAAQPAAIKIEVLDLETNISISYNSIRAAASALNCPESSIRNYFMRVAPGSATTKKPYKKRYVFTITKIDT